MQDVPATREPEAYSAPVPFLTISSRVNICAYSIPTAETVRPAGKALNISGILVSYVVEVRSREDWNPKYVFLTEPIVPSDALTLNSGVGK